MDEQLWKECCKRVRPRIEEPLPYSSLEDGKYYFGSCRNASVARWSAKTKEFFHWRTKFMNTFIETIGNPVDEQVYDAFVPIRLATKEEIDASGGELDYSQYV